MNQKIKRLEEIVLKLESFRGKPSEANVDQLFRMIETEYSLEESQNNDLYNNIFLSDLKETKSTLNDLLDSFDKPKNKAYFFESIIMHFKTDLQNEIERINLKKISPNS